MRRFITNVQHGLEKDRKQERVELNIGSFFICGLNYRYGLGSWL